MHELGAFKWRGALPSLEKYRAGGADAVVTASTGNHGAATAWAAERTGMRAVVFVPEGASAAKVALLEDLGAELHSVGADLDESKDLAREHAAANDLPFFEDGAEPAQFDGYEAIGEEILQQLGRAPGRVLVPVGNGALIIGVQRARPSRDRGGREGGSGDGAERRAAHPVECDDSATFADGMAVRVAIPLAVDELHRTAVRDDAGLRARDRPRGARLRGGGHPRGGVGGGVARRTSRNLTEDDEPTVLIVTGRNIDDELHRRCVEDPDSFPD